MDPAAPATENVLVLCRATPEDSSKHGTIVCVAGLTDHDEFRRLYPVPFSSFVRGGGIKFHKREWIQAALAPPDDKRDKRLESRKIDMTTVRVGAKEDYAAVRERIRRVLSRSIGAIDASGASLGFIRPRLIDYDFTIVEEEQETQQLRFDPNGFLVEGVQVRLPQQSRYLFTCEDSSSCWCKDNPHHMQILDWEVNELYRNVRKNTEGEAAIAKKMGQRMFDFMQTRDLYLLMGTHHRYKNWLIVSILYPEKAERN
jgi:hypothetical protein